MRGGRRANARKWAREGPNRREQAARGFEAGYLRRSSPRARPRLEPAQVHRWRTEQDRAGRGAPGRQGCRERASPRKSWPATRWPGPAGDATTRGHSGGAAHLEVHGSKKPSCPGGGGRGAGLAPWSTRAISSASVIAATIRRTASSADGDVDREHPGQERSESHGECISVVALVPLSEMLDYATDLASLTGGRGHTA